MANPIKVIKLTGVSGSLEGKADAIHTHELSDITDAGSAAAADTSDFAANNHTHPSTDITGLGTAATSNTTDFASVSHNHSLTDITDAGTAASANTTDFASASHTHTLADIPSLGTAAQSDTSDFATSDQGDKADTAIQSADLSNYVVTTDARLSDDRDPNPHTHVLADITNAGSAAASSTSDFATAEQGLKADTALQSVDLSSYVTTTDPRLSDARAPLTHSHPLSEISGVGTAASADTGDFATSAQGLKADNAVPLASIDTLSELNSVVTDATLIDTTDTRLSDARVPTAHTHTLLQITDAGTAASADTADFATATQGLKADNAVPLASIDTLAELNTVVTDATLIDTADARLSDARVPTAHTHTLSQITDAGTAASSDTSDFATATQGLKADNAVPLASIDTLVELNTVVTDATLIDTTDARLSDARVPTAHTHTVSELSDLATSDVTLNTDTNVSQNNWVIDDNTMSSASDATVATSESVKAYVDSQQTESIVYSGNYNANTNSPDLQFPSAGEVSKGELYQVTAAGSFFTTTLDVGDVIMSKVDDPTNLSSWVIVNRAEVTRDSDTNVNAKSWVIDDDTLSTATNQVLATAESIKAYVDSSNATAGDVSSDSIWAAAGDLVYGTGLESAAPLTIGNENDVLTVSSGGLPVWSVPSSGGLTNIVEDTTPELGGDLLVGTNSLTVSGSYSDIPVIKLSDSGSTYATDDFAIQINSGSSYGNAAGIEVVSTSGYALLQGNLKLSSFSTTYSSGRIQLDNYIFDSNESLSGKTGQVLTYDGTTISLAATGGAADDTAYGVSWNGNQDAATKNAIYDKIEGISITTDSEFDAKGDLIVGTANNASARLSAFPQDGKVLTTASGYATGLAWQDPVPSGDPLFIDERSSALADEAGRGQIWVKDETPNELWFTDDAGNDTPIAGATAAAATYGMLYNNANAATSACSTTPTAMDWVSSGLAYGTTPSTSSNSIIIPTAGTYRVEANICCTTDTAGEYQFEIYHNDGTGWSGTGFVADREMPNNGDVGSATVSGIINIAATFPESEVAVYQSIDSGSTSNFLVQSGQLVVTKL